MRPLVLAVLVGCAVSFAPSRGWATPGTHPTMVSTWDTTASSITGGFTGASFGSGGRMFVGSYASSFSSTSGNIGAQFGVHYINYAESSVAPVAHGGSGSAAFVFSAPLLGRHASGLPKVALGFYVGVAPTLLVSGERNYGWVPLTTGIAAPISPSAGWRMAGCAARSTAGCSMSTASVWRRRPNRPIPSSAPASGSGPIRSSRRAASCGPISVRARLRPSRRSTASRLRAATPSPSRA